MEEKIRAAIEALARTVEEDAKTNINGDNVVKYTQAILNLSHSLATLKDLKRP